MSENLAYIESGIWIAKGIGEKDKFYLNSNIFINDNIETGKLKGIVSLISLMEAIDVIRARITSKTDRTILNGMNEKRRVEYLKGHTDEKIRILLRYLRTKEAENKILFADFTIVDLNKIYVNSFNYLRHYFGNIPFYYKCGKCWKDFPHYEYKGIGNIDVLHALLAKEYFCNLFITTDRDFRDLQGSPYFPDLQFEVISPTT